MPTPTTDPRLRQPRLMTSQDLAALLQVHPDRVKRMRQRGDGPPFVTLGRTRLVRYQPRDVAEWLASQTATSTKGR